MSDHRDFTRSVSMTVALVCAVAIAAERGAWDTVGALMTVLAFRIVVLVIHFYDRRAAFDLHDYRIDRPARQTPNARETSDRGLRLAALLVTVAYESAVLLAGNILHLPSWLQLTCIVLALPIGISLALTYERRAQRAQ